MDTGDKMSEFKISPKKISSYSQHVTSAAGIMRHYAQEVNSIGGNIRVHNSSDRNIQEALKKLSRKLDEDSRKTKEMGKALHQIAGLYTNTENRVADTYEGNKVSGNLVDSLDGKLLSGGLFGMLGTFGPASGSTAYPMPNAGAEGPTPEEIREAALLSGMVSGGGTILGVSAQGEAKGNVFGASWDTTLDSGIKWKTEKDANGNTIRKLDSVSLISAGAEGEAHVAQGSVKGNIGLLRGEAAGSVGKVGAEGEVGITLYKDGKISPQIVAEAEASAVGAEGKAEGGVGTENNNVHVGADGKLGVAKAEAGVGIGKVSHTDASGNTVEGYGVKGEAGAEAYAAEGRVSGGITICGIKFDVGLTGKAGGAGVKVGGAATSGGVSGSLGAGLGVGGGIDFSIDWSNFKLGW